MGSKYTRRRKPFRLTAKGKAALALCGLLTIVVVFMMLPSFTTTTPAGGAVDTTIADLRAQLAACQKQLGGTAAAAAATGGLRGQTPPAPTAAAPAVPRRAPSPPQDVWSEPEAVPPPVPAPVPVPAPMPAPAPAPAPVPVPVAAPAAPPVAPAQVPRQTLSGSTGSQRPHLTADVEKQTFVKNMFKHAWKGYREFAWGKDTLKPVSKKGDDNFLGMAITMVDSLDTMLIMGLNDEFNSARDWIATNMKLGAQEDINVFETTIRVIGGLLSAYDLSHDKLFLTKAKEVADKLSFAFDSPTGVPYGTIGLRTHRKYNPSWTQHASTISEVGTLQLEWEYLSRHTGDPKYAELVRRPMEVLHRAQPASGLFPMYLDPKTGNVQGNTITLGARVDSLYDYTRSVKGIEDKLLVRTKSGRLFARELHGSRPDNKMDHLVCFLPGMLALGAQRLETDSTAKRHMEQARDLTKTCHMMYSTTPTGLAPEIVRFPNNEGPVVDAGSKHSLLRPEAVEAFFIMYRLTGDEMYRKFGWDVAVAIEKYARTESGGYHGLKNVEDVHSAPMDNMESFFLGETLKYLYLLFSDESLIPLDKYVFNTEAHPLSIFA